VFREHPGTVLIGTLVALATFVIFYLMTVFALSWGTTALGYSRQKFLVMQLFAILFFAIFIPAGAILAERGRRNTLLWVTAAIGVFGLVMAPMFLAGTTGAVLMMTVGLSLMGLTYGPLGTVLSELFPTSVQYVGYYLTGAAALTFVGLLAARETKDDEL
jgi:MFS family permease